MNTEKKQKKEKRSPILGLVLVALLILILIVTTLAMFTSRDLITNVFDATSMDIVLYEPNWNPAKSLNIVPNTVLPKDPYIVNNEELPAYVFLRVTVPYDNYHIEASNGAEISNGSAKTPLYKFIVTENNYDLRDETLTTDQNVRDCWTLVKSYETPSDASYVYVYAYIGENYATKTLAPLIQNEKTKPLFDKIVLANVNEYFENGLFDTSRDYSVKVEAFGIQTEHLGIQTSNDPAQVWARIGAD